MTSRSSPAWGFGFSSRPAAAGGGQRAPAAVVLQAPSYPPRARRRRRALPRLSRRSPTGRPALGKPEHTYDGRPVVASSLALIHYCMHFFGRKSSKHRLFSNSFTSSELSNGCTLCVNTRTTGCGYFGKGGAGWGGSRHVSEAPSGSSVPGAPRPECARLSPAPLPGAPQYRAPAPGTRLFPKRQAALAKGAAPQHPEARRRR